jgi:hypothetical protein
LVLIKHGEIFEVPVPEVRGRYSVCTKIECEAISEYRGVTGGLKKVAPEVAPII